MTPKALKVAVDEAERFLKSAKACQASTDLSGKEHFNGVLSAAVRRYSLFLSLRLLSLRRSR
jgi:hypothetical protein